MKNLYIHIPFCEKKCFYCSFFVAISQARHVDDYLSCLEKEARFYAGEKIRSVYVGGGTPSFLDAQQIKKLFYDVIYKNFCVMPEAEITFEMNPEHVRKEVLNTLSECGVNRLSIGIQTFDDERLKQLGRNHSSGQVAEGFKEIDRGLFPNVNVDLMYGFSGQDAAAVQDDLDRFVRLDPSHISLYALTIEPNSKFFIQKKPTASQDSAAMQYLLIKEFLGCHRFHQYEISNYCRSGFESSHNRNYWQSGDYLGLGMAAHSHMQGHRWWNYPKILDYMRAVESGEHPIEGEEFLSLQQRIREALVLGLRMNEGVDIDSLQKCFSTALPEEIMVKINEFVGQEFLIRGGSHVRATEKGQLVLDELSSYLV